MTKLTPRARELVQMIKQAQMQPQMGGEYREALAMLDAIEAYVFFNIDDFAGTDTDQLTIGEIQRVLRDKCDHYGQYWETASPGLYARDALVDFVKTGVSK